MKQDSDKKNPRATTTHQPLDAHEWNFRNVKGDQLEACYLYEYAREFFKSSEHLQKFRKEWNEPGRSSVQRYAARRKALDLLSIHCDYFPRIDFDFFPKIAWQDLPAAWPRDLSKEEQQDLRLYLAEQVNRYGAKYRKSGYPGLDIETLRQCEPPKIHSLENFRFYHEVFHHKQDLGNTEYGFFAVNWDFKNSKITEAFTHWLNRQRKERRAIGLKDAKQPISRGGFKDKLNRLCALRVKNHFRHKDLVAHADTNLKEDAPYSHYPDLLDAAKKATEEIKRLFPLQWSEVEWKRREQEQQEWRAKHPLVIPEAILRRLKRS